ncbi:SEL1-like repeat protein [uncultured Parabacteroides sp.]
MCWKGKGIPKDTDQAYVWYKKAADQGLDEVKSMLKYFK